MRLYNPGSLRAQPRTSILAQCIHCERCSQVGREPNRNYRQKSGVVPSIEQERAGNAITYEDTRPAAKCGCGDGVVLRHGSDEDTLAKVFLEAKRIFEENIRQAGKAGQSPFEGKTTMLDVQIELLNALKRYESTSESKARRWLVALSERIAFYGQVFDVLVQHHPEYVSLAWGTFKFIFQAILNHQELVKKLAKGLAQIADLLPRANLSLVLYPTEMMQETLVQLYAHILQFLHHALLWFRQNKLMHTISCIVRPWAIAYSEHFEAIKEDSIRLDKLSDMAAKAELRDTHLEVVEARKEWAVASSEMKLLRNDNQRLAEIIKTGMDRLDQTVISLHKEIQFDFREQADTLCSIQLNQILSISFLEKLPTSGESLEYCQSIRRRSRRRMALPLPEVSRLSQWAALRSHSLLILQGGSLTVSKAFMIDLIDLVRDTKLPIIWALRYANYWDSSTTCTDVLRMLVLQALQMNPRVLAQGPNPITFTHMREAASAADWLRILARALHGLPRIFIALDSGLLSHVTTNNKSEATVLVDLLLSGLPGSVKIFVSAVNLQSTYMDECSEGKACVRLQMSSHGDIHGPLRKRRANMNRNGNRARFRY